MTLCDWFPSVRCHRTYPDLRVLSADDNGIQFPSGVTCRCVNENTWNTLNPSNSRLPTSTCRFLSVRSPGSITLTLVRLCDIGATSDVVWLKLGHLGASADRRCMAKDWVGTTDDHWTCMPWSPFSCFTHSMPVFLRFCRRFYVVFLQTFWVMSNFPYCTGDFVSSWHIENLKGKNASHFETWHRLGEPGERRRVHKIWGESDQYQVSYDFHSSVSFVISRGTWR